MESEYQKQREKCIKASNRLKGKTPCAEGNGHCCGKLIPLIPQDVSFLKAAVASGEIPSEVLSQAVENSQDEDRATCAFLGTDNRCMIYQFRPMVCVAYGLGGYPKSESEEKYGRLFNLWQRKGTDSPFLVSELKQDDTNGFCGQCRYKMVEDRTTIPISCMATDIRAQQFIQRNRSNKSYLHELLIELNRSE